MPEPHRRMFRPGLEIAPRGRDLPTATKACAAIHMMASGLVCALQRWRPFTTSLERAQVISRSDFRWARVPETFSPVNSSTIRNDPHVVQLRFMHQFSRTAWRSASSNQEVAVRPVNVAYFPESMCSIASFMSAYSSRYSFGIELRRNPSMPRHPFSPLGTSLTLIVTACAKRGSTLRSFRNAEMTRLRAPSKSAGTFAAAR